MICKYCNSSIPENSNFCINCGEPIEPIEPIEPTDPFSPAKFTEYYPKKKRTIFDIVGFIAGIFFFFFGIFGLSIASDSMYPNTYGADFYTDIFAGMCGVINSLIYITEALCTLVICFSSFMCCFFGSRLFK